MPQHIFLTQATLEEILEQSKAQTEKHPEAKIYMKEVDGVLTVDYFHHDKLNDIAVPAISSLMGKPENV